MTTAAAPEPTSRRMLRVSAILCALVAVLASGCGGGDGGGGVVSGEPIAFERLAGAADESASAESGRFAFAISASSPAAGEQFSFSGEGAFDAGAERAWVRVDLSSLASILGAFVAGLGAPTDGAELPDFDDPAAWQVEAVQDGDVSYVRFPALDARLPEGKTWIRTTGAADVGGFRVEQFTKTDPRDVLAFLRGVSGEIETVGVEELRGVEATHYRATIDPRAYERNVPPEKREELRELADQLSAQTGLTSVPVDVWLDADGLVRKLVLELAANDPVTSKPASASLSFEIWDLGAEVDISLPPADDVVDESALED